MPVWSVLACKCTGKMGIFMSLCDCSGSGLQEMQSMESMARVLFLSLSLFLLCPRCGGLKTGGLSRGALHSVLGFLEEPF